MKVKFMAVLAAMWLAQLGIAAAPIIDVNPKTKSLEINAGGNSTDVSSAVQKIRNKQVLLLGNVAVYRADLLLPPDDVATLKAKKPSLVTMLNDVSEFPLSGFRLTFIHSEVSAEKMAKAFEDGWGKNGVNYSVSPLKEFLAGVRTTRAAKRGMTLDIVFQKVAGGQERVSYQLGNSTPIVATGGPGLVRNVYSAWFGVSADNGMAKFKREVVEALNK